MAELVIVGGGKMGEALLGGLLESGWSAGDVVVVEPVETRRRELEETHGVSTSSVIVKGEGTVLATKPDVIASVAAAAAEVGTRRLLSIAAGVSTATIDRAVGNSDSPGPLPVIRAMPNTPALVGQAASAIAPNAHASDGDLDWADSILGAVGRVVRVSEGALDAVTGLSGSGPAYVFLVAEAMIEAGVLAGLARPIASELAIQTLLGAATLLAQGRSPAELRADVTSPGGTTAAGLRALEEHGVRFAFLSAVEAATSRSRELGQA
jgi:pyrroline-5-carboxylate reductase